jgi:hypothetical protein
MKRLKIRKSIFSFLLITVLTFSFVNTAQCQNSQTEAEQTITTAEEQINKVFISVCVAEEAGAKVEDLIDELNVALDLILTAHTNFLSGDFLEASNLASSAIEISDEVKNQAEIRKQEALNTSFLQKYRILIIFVIVDIIVCIIGVLLIHMWQRRSFTKKKPKLAR